MAEIDGPKMGRAILSEMEGLYGVCFRECRFWYGWGVPPIDPSNLLGGVPPLTLPPCGRTPDWTRTV